MFRRCLYLFAVILLVTQVSAQRMVRTIKPVKTHSTKTNFSIGLGATNSAVFLQRNTLDNTKITGLSGFMTYDLSKQLRLAVDYTRYRKIDIIPTWYNIHASTIEANLQVLWHSKSNLYFYPMAGLSLNTFKGYFTGLNDFQNLAQIYAKNNNVTTRWLGFNTGVGVEYNAKPFVIFGSFKMRLGFAERTTQLNIVDVCFSAGVRYVLTVPSLYKLFRGTHDRYNRN